MTSKGLSQNALLNPGASPEESIHEEKSIRSMKATVYDAVAGRISAAGFIPKHLTIASTRDTPSSSVSAVPPEAVLFRRKSAPTRYAESDIYFANERESPLDLPDSDLLKALHCYTSDFYSHSTADGGAGDWRSLDETALIAMGILMEEASRDILGKTGDLVFTEGEGMDDPANKSPIPGTNTTLKPKIARPLKKRRIFEDSNMR